MKNLSDIALHYFLEEGYSCSEAITMASAELGYVPKELVNCATGFSGGLSSKCICGALSGGALVLSYNFGKYKTNTARNLCKNLYEGFTKAHKVSCCKALTASFKDDFHSPERKNHCANMIQTSAKLLEEILAEEKIKA